MIPRENFLRISVNTVAVIVCCLMAVLYSLLAWTFPVVHWYDAHIRLALRDQVLLGHWLPLIQLLIVLVSKFTHDLFVLRVLLAIIAGCTLLCMFIFARHLFSSGTALVAMILLATNMMFTALATVPYPEIVFVGLLLSAFYLLDDPPSDRHFFIGIVALNLACLTRYEGWLLAGIFIVNTARETLQTKNWRKFIQATLLASIVPLGWLLFGISASGGLLDRLKAIIAFEIMTDVESIGGRFLSHLNWDYLRAFANNYWHLLNWQAGPWIIFLGGLGWLLALLSAKCRTIHWLIFMFVILDWLLLALWQPWDFTNLRTAFIGEVFLILYAAHGLGQLIHFVFQKVNDALQNKSLSNWENWVLGASVCLMTFNSAASAVGFVAVTSQENDFASPAYAGDWLNDRLNVDDAILALTDDVFQPYALATYTGLGYDTILDDRFDDQQISNRLSNVQLIYIIESYRSRDGLSAKELNLLKALEDGMINTRLFTVGLTRIWLIPKNEIDKLKAIYN